MGLRGAILSYFLLLLICYTHKSLAIINQVPPSLDTSTSGNYIINNCQHVQHSDDVHRLLARFRLALEVIESDLEEGVSSTHGFRTFFKSNANLPIVKKVFRAMAQGQNLTTGKPPVLECVSPEIMTGVYKAVFRNLCTPPRIKRMHAASIVPEGTIILCPGFWEERDMPSEEDCTNVVGRRGKKRFSDHGGDLRNIRFSILVHELIHLYNPLDGVAKKAERYIAQECVELDGQESVTNAENWALYAACELF
ncbi:MAG: hypothetical protein Q9198_001362 [Flavoplaca austrocitrina]